MAKNSFANIESVMVEKDMHGLDRYNVLYRSKVERQYQSLAVPKSVLLFIESGQYEKHVVNHGTRTVYINKGVA